jgi:hypothetical protein
VTSLRSVHDAQEQKIRWRCAGVLDGEDLLRWATVVVEIGLKVDDYTTAL